MARTAATEAPAAIPEQRPPEDPQHPPSPVLAWPSEWPVPVLADAEEQPRRIRSGRGLPMAPVLAGATNATALTATAAYQAGGAAAVAATGVVAAAGATSALLKRRATVRRNMAARGGGGSRGSLNLGSGAGRSSGGRSGGGAGARRSGSGRGSLSGGALGSGRRGPAPKNRKSNSPRRTGSGGGKPRSGLLGPGSTANRDKSSRKSPRSGAGKAGAGKWATVKAAAGRAARAAAQRGSLPRRVGAAIGRHTLGSKGLAGLARGLWRAAGKARAVSAPHRERLRRRMRRGLKRLRGRLWDGLRAAGAGAWAWLRHRDGKAALMRLREVWRRLRKRRASTTDPTGPAAPGVAATVRRPSPEQLSASGGTTVSGHHFTASAMELCRAAANYQPTGMLQVGQDFSGLEEGLRLNAEAMKITVENADNRFPLAPQIVEIMRQIHSLQLKAAELATELQPAFQKLHDVDIARLENPRKGREGERMWDVASNL